jgi:pimeloyl-ACP methyl ester carboxylesterase
MLLIYGEESGPFKPQTLNDMWHWVDGPLTVEVLPEVGHGPHTEVPEIVTPRIMQWLASIGATSH